MYITQKKYLYQYCNIDLIDISHADQHRSFLGLVTELESSHALNRPGSAPLCFISPPVMGKSLLHRVSPCQRYLSAAII